MEYKDYYKTMGVAKDALPDDIKTAYRKLARKYHPDVSKEKNAELLFKDLTEANEVLSNPEKRAAYDQLGNSYQSGQDFQPPPGWNPRRQRSQAAGQHSQNRSDEGFEGFEGFDPSDFESLFRGMGGMGERGSAANFDMPGRDQHAKIRIDIEDSYNGASRTLQMRVPDSGDSGAMQERTIEFAIPKGIRAGQHIRLAKQGSAGSGQVGQGMAGDLYLDVEFLPHRFYRADGADVYMDLPVSPWEAALGGEVEAPTPTGRVEVKIPPGSASGRKLRLKGRGLPGKTPGDFYFVLQLVLPTATTPEARKAYEDMAATFASFKPRATLVEGQS